MTSDKDGLAFFLSLERRVWQALQSGDADADRALLSEQFLGVYPSGLSDRAGHAEQLESGPSVANYRLSEARCVEVAEAAHLLVYRADYRRITPAGVSDEQAMWVSSLWCQQQGHWCCTFSQDTPIEAASLRQ